MAKAFDPRPLPPVDDDYDTEEEEEVIRLSSECTVRSLKRQIAERMGHPLPEESTGGGYWSAIKESIAMHKRRPARRVHTKRVKKEEAQARKKAGWEEARSVRPSEEGVEEEDAARIREEEPLGEKEEEDANSFTNGSIRVHV
ncbi:hypothetical protein PR202_ga21671 [Eleusine coracana subsp. coracana]|uniref:Uncharacterized protein n=1 Tax=Eleusine coracana subsp. coracana TaxID=191504 RepID=A0AAV5D241_ELECO|nr:hypothetical protein PR202_ga21671 [Eleusine coracana subsp. coracana]